MIIVAECGLCGAKIEIPRDADGRFLVWPCHCQRERDLTAIGQSTSIISNMMTPVASKYFRWGTQSRKLYERLKCGPVTGSEISQKLKIHHYHKKIAEIRARIAGTGVTVKARPINGRRKSWEFRLGVENVENKEGI